VRLSYTRITSNKYVLNTVRYSEGRDSRVRSDRKEVKEGRGWYRERDREREREREEREVETFLITGHCQGKGTYDVAWGRGGVTSVLAGLGFLSRSGQVLSAPRTCCGRLWNTDHTARFEIYIFIMFVAVWMIAIDTSQNSDDVYNNF
jgi:hypothetical protein